MRALLCFVFFWLCVGNINAQRSVMRHFDTRNGLPSNEVYQLLNDSKGYIWICTDAGLVKYNGNTFKHFNSSNGMPDNTVFQAKEDRYGRIWYIAYAGKIGYISGDSVHVVDLGKKMEDFLKNGLITSIAFDEKNNLYIGRKSLEHLSFLKVNPPYDSSNVRTVWDESRKIKGICIRVIGENEFVFSDARSLGNKKEFPVTVFLKDELMFQLDTIVPDRTLFTRVYQKNNSIYLVFGINLLKFDLDSRLVKRRKFNSNLITVVSVDTGRVITGESRMGLSYVNENLDSIPAEKELAGNTITYAVKDYQGGIWFSTLESGIYYKPQQALSFLSFSGAQEQATIRIGEMNDTSLIIGTTAGNLYQFSIGTRGPSLKTIYNNSKNTLLNIYTVYPDGKNSISIMSDRGKHVFDPASGKLMKIAGTSTTWGINRIKVEDKYVYQNLSILSVVQEKDGKEIIDQFKSNDRLSSIAYDPGSKTILVGGLRGLYKFNFTNITDKNKLLSFRTEDVKVDPRNTVFVATRSYGLIVISDGKMDTINEQKGLTSNICESLTIDSEFVWLTTINGLSRIKYEGTGRYKIYNYSLASFIDPGSLSRIYNLRGKVVFTSGNRMYWFNRNNEPSFSILNINSVKVNNTFYPVGKKLELKYDQSNVKIEFEALLYDLGSDISYRYKLANKDAWIYTRETAVLLPKLSPGEYSVEIEVLNKQGDWVPFDHSIDFKISKPFFQRWWFIMICFVVIGVIIFLLLKKRYNKMLKKERLESELKISMLELETKVVKAQMNPHFIFNSLNSIQQFILANENENAYLYLTKFSKLVRKLLESTTTEDLTLEDEIDLLNRYIEIEGLRFEDSFSYKLHVDAELKSSWLRVPHMIIQPFVENAIWHGLLHKKGERTLKISFLYLDDRCITCIIEDNGVGRQEKGIQATDKSSLAIEFIEKRLEIINELKGPGSGIKFIDKTEKTHGETGTIVIIRIPIMNTSNYAESNNH